VIKLIEATREETRQDLPEDANPFVFLQKPLSAAVEQLGEEYRQQIGAKTQDDFTKRLAHLLARDDVMEADPELWENLHTWRQLSPPTEALGRSKVADAVRVVRQTAASADLDDVVSNLRSLWAGLTAEGLDRPFERPPSREPSVRDLELVCWELIVTKDLLAELAANGMAKWESAAMETKRLPL
jgi:hypothetical protein